MVSEDKYIKVNINGLLDLEKLSQEYQISKKELVHFHNSYCEISELLPLDLPKYVPFIYLPKNNFETKKSQLLQTNILKYPLGKSEKNYAVVLKYLYADKQIHFEVNVKKDENIIEINKRKSYINNQEIDNIIEKLYETAEQAIYPLKVSATNNGSLSKIENEKEIYERWQKKYFPKLKEYYVSQTADEILEKMNLIFKDLNSKRNFLSNSFLYKLFFLPVYQTYPNYTKESETSFYFANIQKPIFYDIQFFLNREYTRGTKIALQINGKERKDPIKEREKVGTVDLLYKFQKDTQELFSITGSVSTFDKEKELKIEFQIFEIQGLN